MTPSNEVRRVLCPHCSHGIDPLAIARQLPVEVLVSERARRRFKLRRRQAGPGRPKGVAHCPSCPNIFTPEALRPHLLPCLTAKLEQLKADRVEVRPMDTTEWRDFKVSEIRDEIVVLYKLSNQQYVEVPLRSIREVTPAVNGGLAVLTLRGGLRWKEDIQRWRFSLE